MSWAVAGGLSLACIIPDRGIRIEVGEINPGAVRVIERPPLSQDLVEICQAPEELADIAFCPPVRPPTLASGLIAPSPFADGSPRDFCVCPGADNAALLPFDIYAEDPDRVSDDAKDTLYGVLLIDPDPAADDPTSARAYTNYLESCAEGTIIATDDPGSRTYPSEARDPPNVWRFRVDDFAPGGSVDLCNDNEGKQLEPGLHELQFVVSDREFFRPKRRDAEGELLLDERGEVQYGPLQCGVPDLAAGATYATVSYVFECKLPEEADTCDCAEADSR